MHMPRGAQGGASRVHLRTSRWCTYGSFAEVTGVLELLGQLKKKNEREGFRSRNECTLLEYLLSNVYDGVYVNPSLCLTISTTVFTYTLS